ncbi:MAG TPA: DUF885 domain-containing protein [Acidobacteriota bacterium]|nr:DUF885 domain-containing protein [Acidobacteriota bacterium]
MKRVIKWTLLLAVVAAAVFVTNLIWFRPFSINHFYEKIFIEFALKNPELLSNLRMLEPMGIDSHNDDLNDGSDAFAHEMNALIKKDLDMLHQYDPASLDVKQKLSYDILDWFLANQVEGQKYMYHNYPLNQLAGVQSELPSFMASIHYIGKQKDAENYITRLSKFDTRFDQELEGLRIREKKNIIPPKFVIVKVLTEMRKFTNQKPEENILFTSFQQRVKKLSDLNEDEKKDLYKSAQREITNTVYPSYKKLIQYFEQLESKATTDDGVWKLPDGDAFYAYMLQSHTTTKMNPDEVHRLGLQEVSRIQNEMRTILDGLGLRGKTIAQHMEDLRNDPKFQFANTDDGRKQCLAEYQQIIDEIDKGINKVFDVRPAIGVKAQRIPEFKEVTSSGGYYEPPSLDGARKGAFFANLRDMKEVPRWSMRTLAYHEAIPGHHFQIAVQQELKNVPTFRKIIPFTSYIEGWALYAERLAWEEGYEKDPYSDLGRLQDELLRSTRLVCDTGIHAKHWPREQAIQYMKDNTGLGELEITAEVERYIVSPGQACAYKVGQLKILQLREMAKQKLGSKFNIKQFHNVVLQNGAMPLEILEQQVNNYIKSS